MAGTHFLLVECCNRQKLSVLSEFGGLIRAVLRFQDPDPARASRTQHSKSKSHRIEIVFLGPGSSPKQERLHLMLVECPIVDAQPATKVDGSDVLVVADASFMVSVLGDHAAAMHVACLGTLALLHIVS